MCGGFTWCLKDFSFDQHHRHDLCLGSSGGLCNPGNFTRCGSSNQVKWKDLYKGNMKVTYLPSLIIDICTRVGAPQEDDEHYLEYNISFKPLKVKITQGQCKKKRNIRIKEGRSRAGKCGETGTSFTQSRCLLSSWSLIWIPQRTT